MADSRTILATILLTLLAPLPAAADRLIGLVVADDTGEPIDGATVAAGGAVATTNASGVWLLDGLAAGPVEATATATGFEPGVATLALKGAAAHVFRLEPAGGLTTFPIDVSVHDVRSFAPLREAEVTAMRWASSGATGAPDDVVTLPEPDAYGTTKLADAVSGFYRFAVSRTGWEPLVWPPEGDKAIYIGEGRFATAALKPLERSMKVSVKGWDPVADAEGPLGDVAVELTGLGFDDLFEVLEPRTLRTADDGTATFADVHPIRWAVRVLKPGYDPIEMTPFLPDATVAFEEAKFTLALHQKTSVAVTLDSPYFARALDHAPVRLEGIAGTPTEGIVREVTASWSSLTDTTTVTVKRLIPGRYRVTSTFDGWVDANSGLKNANGPVTDAGGGAFRLRTIPATTVVEVADEEAAEVSLWMEPVPSAIRGRLLAVDALQPFAGPSGDVRIRAPMAAKDIRFVMTKAQPFPIVKEAWAEVVVDTDPQGGFAATLIPGLWGVRIPGLAGYTGGEVVVEAASDDPDVPSHAETYRRGWPYPDPWPYKTHDPVSTASWMQFHAGLDARVDLVVHRPFIEVTGSVTLTYDPLSQAVLFQSKPSNMLVETHWDPALLHVPDAVRLTGPDGTIAVPLAVGASTSAPPTYRFEDVGPGSWVLGPEAQGYAFQTPNGGDPATAFTVAPWTPPGVLPAVDPADPTAFQAARRYAIKNADGTNGFKGWSAVPEVPMAVRTWRWNSSAGKYESSGSWPLFVEVPDRPGMLFLAGYGGITIKVVDVPGYKLYAQAQPGSSALDEFAVFNRNESHLYDAYYQGPNANVGAAGRPPSLKSAYPLRLVTVTEDGTEIPGIVVAPWGPNPATTVTSGQVTETSLRISGVSQVLTPGWSMESWTCGPSTDADAALDCRIGLSRQMAVKGTVAWPGGAPAEGVIVRLFNRFGASFGTTTTTAGGTYAFTVPHQPVLVEVREPGFLPERRRFEADGIAKLDVEGADFALAPVPKPEVADFRIDRYGLFLPGLSKTGDASGLDPNNAAERLTATWKVFVTPKDVTYSLDGFDGPLGAGGIEQVTVTDEARRVEFLDRRSFSVADPGAPPQPIDLPAEGWREAVAFLRTAAAMALRETDPRTVVLSPGTLAAPGEAHGKLRLWQMPWGEMKPAAVVLTSLGAVRAVDYVLPAGETPLQGAALPAAVTAVLDLYGTLANSAGGWDLTKAQPRGSIVATPSFQALIDESLGYLTYEYRFGINVAEGAAPPPKGELAMGPRLFGVSWTGTAIFKSKGKDAATELTAQGAFTQEFATAKNLTFPALYRGQTPDKPSWYEVRKLAATGQGAISILSTFGDGTPTPGMNLKSTAQATLDVGVDVAVSPLFFWIPPVKKVLDGLEAVKIAKVRGIFEFLVGGKVESYWSTTPPKNDGYSTKAEVASLLGGAKTTQVFQILLRFALGLRASLFADCVQVHAKAQVGAPKDTMDPGMKLTVNDKAWWPPFKRVEGALSLVGGAKLTVAGVAVSRNFQFDLKRVDWQPNTEPWFDLVRTGETVKVTAPFLAPPATWIGADGTLVRDVYPDAPSAVDAVSGALAFVSTDPATGLSTVMFGLPSGDAVAAPIAVGQAAAVVGLAVTRLMGGEYLVAWSEVEAAGLGDPEAGTRIVFSVSGGGGAWWSAPELVEVQQSVAHHLRLAPAGAGALLAFEHAGSFGAELQSVRAASWDGGGWTASQEVHAAEPLLDVALAADPGGDEAVVAVLDEAGRTTARAWDGSDWGAAADLGADWSSIAVAWRPGGGCRAVGGRTGQGVVSASREGGEWSTPTPSVPEAVADRISAAWTAGSSGDRLAVAWVRHGALDEAVYAFLDASGALVDGPTAIPADGGETAGDIVSIAVFAVPGEYRAAVVVRRAGGDGDVVSQSLVTPGEAPVDPPESPGAPEVVGVPEVAEDPAPAEGVVPDGKVPDGTIGPEETAVGPEGVVGPDGTGPDGAAVPGDAGDDGGNAGAGGGGGGGCDAGDGPAPAALLLAAFAIGWLRRRGVARRYSE